MQNGRNGTRLVKIGTLTVQLHPNKTPTVTIYAKMGLRSVTKVAKIGLLIVTKVRRNGRLTVMEFVNGKCICFAENIVHGLLLKYCKYNCERFVYYTQL